MHDFWLNAAPILAQVNDDQAGAAGAAAVMAFFATFFIFICGGFVFALVIQAVICWFLSGCLKAIPPEHRKQQPNMVWLLMIPLVSLVWNFFVYPKIADSFKSYFTSVGRADVGDCGRGLGITFSILVCCIIVPYVGWACASAAALIVLIIVLVKFATLKKQIVSSGVQRV